MDPGCLEALACREALALAADSLVGRITVALDCLDVIKGCMANTWVRTVISSWRSRRWSNTDGELVSAIKDGIVIQKLIF
jgi:hypothetical protein